MSTANNNALVPILPGVISLPCSNNTAVSSTYFNAGDLVWFDLGQTLNNGRVLAPVTSDAQAGSSIGVSQDSNPITSISPTSFKIPAYAVVNFNVVFKFNSTTGDTYNWFDPLYIGTSPNGDPQTLTNTAGGKTNVLARVYFPPSDENGNTISPPVAGGTGVLIRGVVKPLFANLGVL